VVVRSATTTTTAAGARQGSSTLWSWGRASRDARRRSCSGVPARAWDSATHWTDHIVPPQHKPQNETEDVLGKFGVSLRYGLIAVGGRVIVTTQRLLFEAHRLNIMRTPVSLFLSDIIGIRVQNSLGVIPNGFVVKCRSGKEYHFIAFNRQPIMDLLARQTRLPIG